MIHKFLQTAAVVETFNPADMVFKKLRSTVMSVLNHKLGFAHTKLVKV